MDLFSEPLSHGVELGDTDSSERDQRLREVIRRVVVAPDALSIEVLAAEVATLTPTSPSKTKQRTSATAAIPSCPFTPTVTVADGVETLTLPIAIKRHDGRRILVSPDGHDLMVSMNAHGRPVPKSHLVNAVGHAFALHRELIRTRDTIELVAARFGITEAWARMLLDLTTLSPSILKGVLTGTLPATVTLQDLRHAARHLDWSLQEAALKG